MQNCQPQANRALFKLPAMTPTLMFRLTGHVTAVDDTTPNEPGHPALALIIECGDDLARIVIPAFV